MSQESQDRWQVRPLRIYIDTSVVGGCLDEEFAEASRELLKMARAGKAVLLVSDLLLQELEDAPSEVRDLLSTLPPSAAEPVETTDEAGALSAQYVEASVVGESSARDALHVALATVAGADMIVSWNFRHIVHHDKIRGFHAVNLRRGYPMIGIYSPLEVV